MADWCRAWLIDGASLYGAADAATDYPPNAIVLLSPLALVPSRWLVPLWTAGAVALAPVLPWLVLRCALERPRPTMLAVPALLYLCWAAPRTLLQFSVLSLTLACCRHPSRRPSRWFGGGAVLGLALFKPHIAGPIALWMMVSGRLRPLIAAAAVVCLGLAAYDVRLGENPLTTARGWWA